MEGSNAENRDRDSNALRASVLDAALQLGLGTNKTVANWMFNDPIAEEEAEDLPTPDLTHSLHGTSDDSIYASPNAQGAGAYIYPSYPMPSGVNSDGNFRPPNLSPAALGQSPSNPFDGSMPANSSTSRFNGNKLRKSRKTEGGGYESDGGYVSDGLKKGKKDKEDRKKRDKKDKKDDKERKEREEKDKKDTEKKEKRAEKKRDKKTGEEKTNATDYETDGGYISEATRAFRSRTKSKKRSKSKSRASSPTGYETDSSKPKPKPKKKGSFFSRAKASRSDADDSGDSDHDAVPPMPALPLPLPIAERFATSPLPDRSLTPTTSITSGSRAFSPIDASGSSTANTSLEEDRSKSSTDSRAPTPRERDYTQSPVSFFSQQQNKRAVHFERAESTGSGSSGSTRAVPAISLPNTNMGGPPNPPVPSTGLRLDTTNLSPVAAPGPKRPRPLALLPSGDDPTYLASHTPVSGAPSPSSFVLVTPVATSAQRTIPDSSTLPIPRDRSPPESVVASSEYIVPSPHQSALPTPRNVLAYYDIPPPSPPPNGPLPRPPPPSRAPTRDIPPTPTAYTPASSPTPPSAGGRGRQAPFPAKPARPIANKPTRTMDGFEARVRVERYRGLYGFDGINPPPQAGQRAGERAVYAAAPGINIEYASDDEGSPQDDTVNSGKSSLEKPEVRRTGKGNVDDIAPRDLGQVLAERFEVQGRQPVSKFKEEIETIPSIGSVDDDGLRYADEFYVVDDEGKRHHFRVPTLSDDIHNLPPANMPRDVSMDISVLQEDDDDDDASHYPPDARDTLYSIFDQYGGMRDSRYAPSAHSRVSIMDQDKSEETRSRFVNRVENMFGPNGREREMEVPPVPKIPEGLSASSKRWI